MQKNIDSPGGRKGRPVYGVIAGIKIKIGKVVKNMAVVYVNLILAGSWKFENVYKFYKPTVKAMLLADPTTPQEVLDQLNAEE